MASNQAHQGGKIPGIVKREEMIKNLGDIEFHNNDTPVLKPDIIIYLDLPVDLALTRLNKREKGETDSHEQKEHLDSTRNAYRMVATYYEENTWKHIDCAPNSVPLPEKAIAYTIQQAVMYTLKIQKKI